MQELVSIVTPVYKAGKYIAETVESVLAQTYREWEWILVDDHSPDDTVSVIRSILNDKKDDRIRLIELEKNGGAAHARNTGVDAARGRYLAFLDADDKWFPDRISECLEHMKRTGAGFVFTAYEFGDEKAVGTGRIVHVPEKLEYRQALSRTVIFTSTTLFDKRKIPVELMHMPDVPSEDTATWWQILRAGYTAYGLDRVTVIYRRPGGSLSSNKAVAVRRIWNLYRRVEKLGLISSFCNLAGWAYRATVRRL